MRTKTKKHNKKKKPVKKTIKRRNYKIPSTTSLEIRNISKKIFNKLENHRKSKHKSYIPTINHKLVPLMSIPRKHMSDCNIVSAFELKEPLQIGISGKRCVKYNTPEAKQFLLHNLSANKHIDIKKIVPPIQLQSNCWFNAFFVTFFVSDKGRQFFHYFRQLMIEGKNKDGAAIPYKLRDAFALLNFGIDACLTGNKFAYELNTNSIIKKIYDGIPNSYKKNNPYIVDVDQAGNPLLYYISIINYLNNNSVLTLFMRNVTNDWKNVTHGYFKQLPHLPHLVVFEIYDETADDFKKPLSFNINGAKYQIDSTVVRDISKQHFCSTVTCEKKEMTYDGMSFHRIEALKWKDKLNVDFDWQFEGTTHQDGTPLRWNYTKCYQILIYYRVK
jgi:hypothetical protein